VGDPNDGSIGLDTAIENSLKDGLQNACGYDKLHLKVRRPGSLELVGTKRALLSSIEILPETTPQLKRMSCPT
jgi:hypothetical protein